MLKRILVGLGGTEYTVSAINQAVALAMAHDAEVTGVSIIDEGRLTLFGPVPIGGGHYAHELAERPHGESEGTWSSGPCKSSPRRAERPACGIKCCVKWANRSR